ncbi:hypothetical protein EYF80_020543 [Liparis tanakae]|uniref:Uncharacterized protein n=1 Tax=Liparis tanakae TaxID=230148 RepID=A0A4Z2HTQ2_9TELE|nr:hypothetical protein EYF80_020543 [Liparis tanakae]
MPRGGSVVVNRLRDALSIFERVEGRLLVVGGLQQPLRGAAAERRCGAAAVDRLQAHRPLHLPRSRVGSGRARLQHIGSSHLHLQHLVENRLGQAFSNVPLVVPVDQLVSVLLVWNDTPTPADLRTATVSAGFEPRCLLIRVLLKYPARSC